MNVNEHGLMGSASARELVERYGCKAAFLSDLVVEVQFWSWQVKDTLVRSERVVCVQTCLWKPLDLITACRVAKGQPMREINFATARVTNPGNLNETKIALHLAAVGIRPFLQKAGNYFVNEAGLATRPIAQDGGCVDEPGWRRAGVGEWTWSMRRVMTNMEDVRHGALHTETSDWRASVYVLSHAGLIETIVDERFGWKRNRETYRWTALAYLDHDYVPPSARPTEPEQLDIDDEAAIAALSGI